LQQYQKKYFLARCQKRYFFCGDEGVSNFKKSQKNKTTVSMTKSQLLTTKAAATAKKKAGRVDLFQSNFTKSWYLLYCMLLQEFVVCLPSLFISFFDKQQHCKCMAII
jgi:hypothetical protein